MMKIRVFVTCSASVLLLWLGVTYVLEAPRQYYPRLGRESLPISAGAQPARAPVVLTGQGEQDRTADSLAGAE